MYIYFKFIIKTKLLIKFELKKLCLEFMKPTLNKKSIINACINHEMIINILKKLYNFICIYIYNKIKNIKSINSIGSQVHQLAQMIWV